MGVLEKGSTPEMRILPAGTRFLPARRRSKVVLPAPLAPMRRVRDEAGRESVMSVSPRVWLGKV